MQRFGANTKESNPCFDEQELSNKCMKENDYDNSKCVLIFDNYNACRRFWGAIESQRRKAGVKPIMPTLEERIEIKAQRAQRMTEIKM